MEAQALSANEALLLIGHGSARYPDAASALQGHAESLRREKRFDQVAVGLLNGGPSVAQALADIQTAVIRVVPFFMEDGYFTRVAVPRALGDRPVILCPPIGVHDGMARLIERQARAGCALLGTLPHTATLLIVGHGSARAPGRALALHRHAKSVTATGVFASVTTACLEEAPFVADALRERRAHPVVVVGFFANRGGHVRDDLPALIAAEQAVRGPAGLAMRFHGSVSDDTAMTQIILDQALHDPRGE
jgi:sirohydrochlorin cobaltochelatase